MAEPVTASPRADIDEEARWRQLTRMTGIAGLAVFVLTAAWIVTTSVSGAREPAFDGDADAVLAFFRATGSTLAGFGSYLVVVAMVALIWFAIGLALLLGRADGVCPGLRRPGPQRAGGGSVVSRPDSHPAAGHLRVRRRQSGVRQRLGSDGQLHAVRRVGNDQHPLRAPLAGLVGRGGWRRSGAEPGSVDEPDLAAPIRVLLALGDHHLLPAAAPSASTCEVVLRRVGRREDHL